MTDNTKLLLASLMLSPLVWVIAATVPLQQIHSNYNSQCLFSLCLFWAPIVSAQLKYFIFHRGLNRVRITR